MDASLRTAEGMGKIVISSDDEEELSRQITVSSASGPSTSKTGARTEQGAQELVLEF